MTVKCIKAYVEGIVQGVYYRDSTRTEAQRRNIRGYAKNLMDGRVEVVACGSEEAIDELIVWLRHGPEQAKVTNVEVEEISQEVPAGFICC